MKTVFWKIAFLTDSLDSIPAVVDNIVKGDYHSAMKSGYFGNKNALIWRHEVVTIYKSTINLLIQELQALGINYHVTEPLLAKA